MVWAKIEQVPIKNSLVDDALGRGDVEQLKDALVASLDEIRARCCRVVVRRDLPMDDSFSFRNK